MMDSDVSLFFFKSMFSLSGFLNRNVAHRAKVAVSFVHVF